MIANKTKETVLVSRFTLGDSILFKARGLMFSRKIYDTALVFRFASERRMDLHMLFVFFPIDVLFLGKEKKVIEIKENFLPFTFYYSRERAAYVVELPKGSIRKSSTNVGDILEF